MSPATLNWITLIGGITLKSTVILTVAWGATRIARRGSAAVRHMIWMVALGATLLLPFLEAIAPHRTVVGIPTAPAYQVSASDVTEPELATVGQLSQAEINLLVSTASTESDPAPPLRPSKSHTNPVAWLTAAWAFGSVAVLVSVLAGWIVLRRIEARTISLPSAVQAAGGRRPVRLKVSRERRPPSALTWGALRPTILLPKAADTWPNDRLETVLLHELEHVRRWDAAKQLVGVAACALYWFNPIVWLASKAARAEAEAATDDAVLLRGVRPSEYANTLMEVAAEIGRRSQLFPSTGVAFMRKSKIEARLRAILDTRTRRGVTRVEKLIALSLAVVVISPLVVVRAAAVQPFVTITDGVDPTAITQVGPTSVPHVLTVAQKRAKAAHLHHLRAVAKLKAAYLKAIGLKEGSTAGWVYGSKRLNEAFSQLVEAQLSGKTSSPQSGALSSVVTINAQDLAQLLDTVQSTDSQKLKSLKEEVAREQEALDRAERAAKAGGSSADEVTTQKRVVAEAKANLDNALAKVFRAEGGANASDRAKSLEEIVKVEQDGLGRAELLEAQGVRSAAELADTKAAVAFAQENLAQVRALADPTISKSGSPQAVKALEAALKLEQSKLARSEQLYKAGVLSATDLDGEKIAVEMGRANLESARAALRAQAEKMKAEALALRANQSKLSDERQAQWEKLFLEQKEKRQAFALRRADAAAQKRLLLAETAKLNKLRAMLKAGKLKGEQLKKARLEMERARLIQRLKQIEADLDRQSAKK